MACARNDPKQQGYVIRVDGVPNISSRNDPKGLRGETGSWVCVWDCLPGMSTGSRRRRGKVDILGIVYSRKEIHWQRQKMLDVISYGILRNDPRSLMKQDGCMLLKGCYLSGKIHFTVQGDRKGRYWRWDGTFQECPTGEGGDRKNWMLWEWST
jgi:hypothetical protein